MRNVWLGLVLLGIAGVSRAATGATPAVDDLARSMRNFQDLDSWTARVVIDVKGKSATIGVKWTGSQMIMDVTTAQGKRYFAMFEKGKSFLSPDNGQTWEADPSKVAEQQLSIVMNPVNWDGKGTPLGKYDWAGVDTVDGEKCFKLGGTGMNAKPAMYWIYDHPKYGKMVKKSTVEIQPTTDTLWKVTVVYSEPYNKNPRPAR